MVSRYGCPQRDSKIGKPDYRLDSKVEKHLERKQQQATSISFQENCIGMSLKSSKAEFHLKLYAYSLIMQAHCREAIWRINIVNEK